VRGEEERRRRIFKEEFNITHQTILLFKTQMLGWGPGPSDIECLSSKHKALSSKPQNFPPPYTHPSPKKVLYVQDLLGS
jgi:hypothetical protein